jgi:phage terminase small subunit
MPALENARHERFAQEMAKGKTATEAYASAGYAPNDGNATRLKGNDRIAARIAEIQERAAVRTEITVASITDRLLKIAQKGEMSEDAPMLSVARASLMDAAKLNGLVVDKNEHGGLGGGPIQVITGVPRAGD